jgi:hypothetical protein
VAVSRTTPSSSGPHKTDAGIADDLTYSEAPAGHRTRETAAPHARAECFDCHDEHAATDHVFSQFYPAIR